MLYERLKKSINSTESRTRIFAAECEISFECAKSRCKVMEKFIFERVKSSFYAPMAKRININSTKSRYENFRMKFLATGSGKKFRGRKIRYSRAKPPRV